MLGDVRRPLQVQRLQQRNELVQRSLVQKFPQLRVSFGEDLLDGILARQRHVHLRDIHPRRNARRVQVRSELVFLILIDATRLSRILLRIGEEVRGQEHCFGIRLARRVEGSV